MQRIICVTLLQESYFDCRKEKQMQKVIHLKSKVSWGGAEFKGKSIFCPLCGSANRFMHDNSADLFCDCGAVIPARAMFDIMVASGKIENKNNPITIRYSVEP